MTERNVDELLGDFQSACEDYMLCSEPEQPTAAKHRALLRNELRKQLLDASALTARAVRAEQPLTELQTLVTAFVRDYGRCGDWDEDSLVAGRFFADAVNLLGKLSTSAATP